jgi:hypothetical protein
MKSTEKAIRDFCGHHADWWPSTTQVQEMLALAQPCLTCEALARTVMLDQTSHDTRREWVGLTHNELIEIYNRKKDWDTTNSWEYEQAIEAKLKDKNT